MILTKLRLQNFKRYKNETEINLEVDNRNQNIVLIDAMNGAGKTSILQAVRGVFFGLENSDFHKFLNYEARESGDFSIKLTIEYSDNDFNPCVVTRTYKGQNKDSVPNSKIYFSVSGISQDVTAEIWDEYLNKNFPKEISNFFLFDGEQLEYLLDPKDPKKVKNAIEKILGIETIRNLRNNIIDLKSNTLREVQTLTMDKKIQIKEMQLSEQENLKNDIRLKIDLFNQTYEEASSGKNDVGVKISNLAKEGLTKEKINERDLLIKNLAAKHIEIAKIDLILEIFKTEFIDKFLLSTFTNLINVQIEKEELVKKSRSTLFLDENNLHKIIFALYKPFCIVGGDELSEDKEKLVISALKKAFLNGENISDEVVLLDLSKKETNLIIGFLEKVKKGEEYKVTDLIDQKINLINILDAIERKIEDLDREMDLSQGLDFVGQLYEELNQYSQEMNRAELQLKSLEESLNKINSDILRLQKEIEESMMQNNGLEPKKRYLDTLNKLNAIFDSYVTSLVKNTKSKLEEKTFEMFKLLTNTDIYGKIEINDDFQVRLIDKLGNYQDALNSGHIQILMTSMLWGLEQLSDFKLPIIIDTPLARLDPVHRKHMLEKYFSIAGGQVIILSTLSEISDSDKKNSVFSQHLRNSEYIKLNFNSDELQIYVEYIKLN